MLFESLGISKNICNLLKKKGIKEPTEIQEKVIPFLLSGGDLIAKSETGTGKTLAFILPIIEKVYRGSKEKTLIFVPTRELCMQINEVIKSVDIENKVIVTLIYGGRELSENRRLEKDSNIIIATPGRILEWNKNGNLDFKDVNRVILDEADQMIELGFKNEIEEIMNKLSKKRETLFFSATLASNIKKIAYRYANNPKIIEINKDEKILDSIVQKYVNTTDRRKIDILCQMINEDKPFLGIIFCRTKVRVDKLDSLLTERGYTCQKIHSDIPQPKREKIIKSFKNLEVQFLIATDIVARGIDIKGVSHIYNYDAPESYENYQHRVGRTGRAGEKGESFLILTEKDIEFLNELKRKENIKLVEREVLYEQDIKNTSELPTQKYNKKINISSKKIEEIKIIKERSRIQKEFKNKS